MPFLTAVYITINLKIFFGVLSELKLRVLSDRRKFSMSQGQSAFLLFSRWRLHTLYVSVETAGPYRSVSNSP